MLTRFIVPPQVQFLHVSHAFHGRGARFSGLVLACLDSLNHCNVLGWILRGGEQMAKPRKRTRLAWLVAALAGLSAAVWEVAPKIARDMGWQYLKEESHQIPRAPVPSADPSKPRKRP